MITAMTDEMEISRMLDEGCPNSVPSTSVQFDIDRTGDQLEAIRALLPRNCQQKNTPCKRSETKNEVSHPPHYTQGGIECIDAIAAALSPEELRGFLKGNVIKYLWRAKHKGAESKDYEKAAWYLARLNSHMQQAGTNV